MKYMLLMYANEAEGSKLTPEELKAIRQDWFTYMSEAQAAGVLLANDGLQPVTTATTVRVRDGKSLITDGPFAETHEQLGGYSVIECDDLDEAIRWAEKIPPRSTAQSRSPVVVAETISGMSAAAQIEKTFREEHGRILAALISQFGDFTLAEDALQDALVNALERWEIDGVPRNPGAWLLTVARRRLIDRIRRATTQEHTAETIAHGSSGQRRTRNPKWMTLSPDDRLKLMFTCCHPALALDAQVALTLHTLGRLSTPEIARAFLVPVPTMAQRLARARAKIRNADPLSCAARRPAPRTAGRAAGGYLPDFQRGYAATSGETLTRHELCEEAIRLCRVLVDLLPDSAEARGLLALMLLHDSRREARLNPEGELVLLDEQDRARWDQAKIREGTAVLDEALALFNPGPYQVQAAISALHAEAATPDETDWPQIAALYDTLVLMMPSPVVEVNRAVAVAMADGPAAGLELLHRIEGVEDFYPYHVARAELLRRTNSARPPPTPTGGRSPYARTARSAPICNVALTR